MQGRHVFLLGQNGNGKSSIVEAIRWGLFGSTGRPNEVVDNRGYAGACRVILSLTRSRKKWSLRRSLTRGVSGGSDARLYDEMGRDHLIREVMPQLGSADAGEGTYIIYSSQAVPLRRQPRDLTPFERTVFNHLGLTHPQSLLSQVNDVINDQMLVENSLGEQLTNARENIHRQIDYVQTQRRTISSSPPWEGNQVPSIIQSENKAKALIGEINRNVSDKSLEGVSLDGLIQKAEDALNTRPVQSELEEELANVVQIKAFTEKVHQTQWDIAEKQSQIKEVQCELDAILEGASHDDLRCKIANMKATEKEAVLQIRIAEGVLNLLNSIDAESVQCPVCESEHARKDLEARLANIIAQSRDTNTSDIAREEKRLSEAEVLKQIAETKRGALAALEVQLQNIIQSLKEKDVRTLNTPDGITDEHLDKAINKYSEIEDSIRNQIHTNESWLNEKQAQLSNLKRESSFHSLGDKLKQLRGSKNRFEEANNAYNNLVSFGKSVRTIQQNIGASLNEQLRAGIPGVSENLSRFFSALTRHPWFDRLDIDKDKLPKLELRVASSQDPAGTAHPTDVLNGQAESALELVPYFAFSQVNDAPTEIHLVLLDDPTRAFDEEHIDILVERLAELGQSVQLIVASQETTRFRALLPNFFTDGEYVIIEPSRWSYHDGPKLSIEYS